MGFLKQWYNKVLEKNNQKSTTSTTTLTSSDINNILSDENNQDKQLSNESQSLDIINTYEDQNGQKYTKQRLFESILSMCSGSLLGGGSFNGSWMSAVENMGRWYAANIHTYQGTTQKPRKGKTWYSCPLIGGKDVADDCSGFVQACLLLFGVKCPVITTATMNESPFMKMMETAGFQHIDWSGDESVLRIGDIMCGGPQTHTEIFAGVIGGRKKSYSWGNIHDEAKGGLPCGFYMKSRRHIWRKN